MARPLQTPGAVNQPVSQPEEDSHNQQDNSQRLWGQSGGSADVGLNATRHTRNLSFWASLFDDTHLFVLPIVWLGAGYRAAFAGWPRETDSGAAAAAAAELQMKQINGGNWVETLQISSKQFWESGDTEWQDSAIIIIAESLFTGSVKAIASRVFGATLSGSGEEHLSFLEDVSAWNARRVFADAVRWVPPALIAYLRLCDMCAHSSPWAGVVQAI